MSRVAAAVGVVETALRLIAAACLFGMFALVVAQVALRYGGGGVPAFTEEVARYAMIWMALLAAAIAAREASHIRIELLPGLLRASAPWASRALEALLDVLSLGIFLVLVWQGVDMVAFAYGQTSEGLQIRLAYPYAAVPIAFAFACLFALARLVTSDLRA